MIECPKLSAIETCTYFTSKLRSLLHSVLWTHVLAPNGHIAWKMTPNLGYHCIVRIFQNMGRGWGGGTSTGGEKCTRVDLDNDY